MNYYDYMYVFVRIKFLVPYIFACVCTMCVNLVLLLYSYVITSIKYRYINLQDFLEILKKCYLVIIGNRRLLINKLLSAIFNEEIFLKFWSIHFMIWGKSCVVVSNNWSYFFHCVWWTSEERIYYLLVLEAEDRKKEYLQESPVSVQVEHWRCHTKSKPSGQNSRS